MPSDMKVMQNMWKFSLIGKLILDLTFACDLDIGQMDLVIW